ncbi:MAG: hypothetical protein V1688_02280, partial [bacterium]
MHTNNEKKRFKYFASIYPFDEYEYVIANLLKLNKIKLSDYLEIKNEYLATNEYLYIYEKYESFKEFKTTWAQGHIKELAQELVKPTKKLDKSYSGEYDFLYQLPDKKMIKIEVKASRAVDFKSQEPLYVKALAWESKLPF